MHFGKIDMLPSFLLWRIRTIDIAHLYYWIVNPEMRHDFGPAAILDGPTFKPSHRLNMIFNLWPSFHMVANVSQVSSRQTLTLSRRHLRHGRDKFARHVHDRMETRL